MYRVCVLIFLQTLVLSYCDKEPEHRAVHLVESDGNNISFPWRDGDSVRRFSGAHSDEQLSIEELLEENKRFQITEDKCSGVSRRIFGGRAANITEVPYQVAIRRKLPEGRVYENQCGGTLITFSHVLTAAHCFNISVLIQDWRLVAGTTRTRVSHNELLAEEWRRVRSYYIHENFLRQTLNNDIAIAEAEFPFTMSPTVEPIRIHTSDLGWEVQPRMECLVSGYGNTKSVAYQQQPILHLACVPVLSYEDCSAFYPPEQIPPSTLCAGSRNGTGVCFGDSGGALVCRGALAGIVSSGYTCGGTPAVFVRLLSYTVPRAQHDKTEQDGAIQNCCSKLLVALVMFNWFVLIK